MSQPLPASHIGVQRAYDATGRGTAKCKARGNGDRILVDRLWPRGVSKDDLAIDHWAKDLAPSTSLRQWFGHEPARWPEFCARYKAELQAHPQLAQALKVLRARARKGRITLVYAAHDPLHNNAVALRQILLSRSGPARRVPKN